MVSLSSNYSVHHTIKSLLLAVLIVVNTTVNFVSPLKVYSPDSNPVKTTPAPNNRQDSGLNLPHIHLLNTSSDYFADSSFHNGGLDGNSLLFRNETVYVVPRTRNTIMIQCEANYPVFWNLAHSRIHPNTYSALRVLSMRKFDDPFDPSTFTYVTILTMNGPNSQLTGNYSCQSTARHEIQSSIFVFWETTFGDLLILSKENLTIALKSDKDDIHLPCYVADPDAQPKLIKLGQDSKGPKDEQLPLNESILFFPTTGFTLKNLPNPLGTYKCSLDQNDYLIIHVLHKNESNPSSSSSEPNYTFQYDEDKKQVMCCAKMSGKKPPKVYMMMCEHPSTCGLREFLNTDGTAWYPWNQGRRRGSCSVLSLKTTHTGIVRCIGDGYSEYKEFIVPVRVERVPWNHKRNTTTYFRWEEIDPQEMIAVGFSSKRLAYLDYDGATGLGITGSQRKSQVDRTIYSKELIDLECHMSRYYFATGNYWMVRWKNQTISQLDVDNTALNVAQQTTVYYDDRNHHSDHLSLVAHADMESLICFAPVWNSSIWVSKIHYLYVNESMSPLLPNGDVNETVHFTWYANETEKILTCSASGVPSPEFHWEKDNTTVLQTSHNYNVFQPNVTTPQNTTTTTEATTTTTTTTTTAVSSDVGGGDANDDNQEDDNNNNSKDFGRPSSPITRKLSHSSLRINRVSYSTRGVFRCVATNFGGKVTKEFHITVLEAKSWTATIFFVISCALTVLLMIGIIYLLRRLHKDRQEINQLTSSSVNFQNGGAIQNSTREGGGSGGSGVGGLTVIAASSTSSGSVSTSSSKYQQHFNEEDSFHNSISFDNGNMTNNLIDAF